MLSVPASMPNTSDDARERTAAQLHRHDGVLEVGAAAVAGDRGDLGIVLGEGASKAGMKCSGLMRANGGTPKGSFHSSKKGFLPPLVDTAAARLSVMANFCVAVGPVTLTICRADGKRRR